MPHITPNQLSALVAMAANVAQAAPSLSPYRIASTLTVLQQKAAALHRRYTAACSHEWACTEKYERRTENEEHRVKQIAAAVPGLTVQYQRDPRGWPLILKLDGKELGRLG